MTLPQILEVAQAFGYLYLCAFIYCLLCDYKFNFCKTDNNQGPTEATERVSPSLFQTTPENYCDLSIEQHSISLGSLLLLAFSKLACTSYNDNKIYNHKSSSCIHYVGHQMFNSHKTYSKGNFFPDTNFKNEKLVSCTSSSGVQNREYHPLHRLRAQWRVSQYWRCWQMWSRLRNDMAEVPPSL